jgi:hypothetical protein
VVDYDSGFTPIALAIADVNGDGPLDLVVTNPSGSSMSVLLGQGDGTFAARTDYATTDFPTSIAVQDLNGDGRPDLAVTEGSTTVRALLNVCFP